MSLCCFRNFRGVSQVSKILLVIVLIHNFFSELIWEELKCSASKLCLHVLAFFAFLRLLLPFLDSLTFGTLNS